MISKKDIITNMAWNRTALIVSILLIWVLLHILAEPIIDEKPPNLTAVAIEPINVRVAHATGRKSIFRVYYPSHNPKLATALGVMLSKSLEKSSGYSSVEVTYYLGVAERDRRIRTHRSNDKFNLLLIKPHILDRLTLLENINYIPLATYNPYDVFLISKEKIPELSGQYLAGKKLGLLAKPTSQSGYIIPKNMINKHIDPNEFPIFKSKYASHFELREALQRDEVDMISTYWTEEDGKAHKSWNKLKIGSIDKGATWFIEPGSLNNDSLCLIARALKSHAGTRSRKYWSSLSLKIECKSDAI